MSKRELAKLSNDAVKKQKFNEMSLFWFRMDLRLSDNLALLKARQSGRVVCIFIISPKDWKRHHVAPIKVDFWLRNLVLIQAELKTIGIPLIIRFASSLKDVPKIVLEVAVEIKANNLFYNIEYEIHELKRDADTTRLLEECSIVVCPTHDQCIAPPGLILSEKGKEYAVFSPFKKRFISAFFKLYLDGFFTSTTNQRRCFQ